MCILGIIFYILYQSAFKQAKADYNCFCIWSHDDDLLYLTGIYLIPVHIYLNVDLAHCDNMSVY